MIGSHSKNSRWAVSAFAALCAAIFLKIFLDACIFDDPYITFRVVDNFVHGYGLRWNVDDRVQAYTHPLWMLLHIPFYALFGNIYWVTIGLSVVFGISSVVLLTKLAGEKLLDKSLLILLPLALSRTFRVYVICGMENPLTFFLFAWILFELFGRRRFDYYRFCFVAALCIITRLDNIVPLAPLIAALTWSHRREIRVKPLLIALSPAIAWYAFSLFYYGFFLPNTKYAKLGMGVSMVSYVRQGLYYGFNFVKCDPLAFLWSCAGIVFALRRFPAAWRERYDIKSKDALLFLLGAGCVLNVIYVVLAGGDFMPGRFFANIFILSVGIIAVLKSPLSVPHKKIIAASLLVITFYNSLVIQPNLPDRRVQTLNHGIDDQHDYNYATNGLRSDPDHFLRLEPQSSWINEGKSMAAEAGDGFKVFPTTCSGMKFYYGGPHIIVVDRVGLADALLARLPINDFHNWRVGHSLRNIPPGYLLARETGDFSQMDPNLAYYYGKLRLVTAGPLFSFNRLHAILGFQLAWYDDWLNMYIYKTQPPPPPEPTPPPAAEPAAMAPAAFASASSLTPTLAPAMNFKGVYKLEFGGITFGKAGLDVTQDAAHYTAGADVALTGALKFFIKHSSHTVTGGSGKNFVYPNVNYQSDYHTNQKVRSVHLVYKGGVLANESAVPLENPWKRQMVPANLKNSAVDPVSALLHIHAALAAALAQKKPGFSLNIYDGRHLIGIDFAVEDKRKIRYGGATVPVVAVSVRYRPLAGFTPSELKGQEANKPPPLMVYFSDDGRLIPLKLEVQLPLGSISATLARQCGEGESCLLGNKD